MIFLMGPIPYTSKFVVVAWTLHVWIVLKDSSCRLHKMMVENIMLHSEG